MTVVPLESSSLKRDEVAVREDPNHGNALFSLLGVAFFFFKKKAKALMETFFSKKKERAPGWQSAVYVLPQMCPQFSEN